MTLRMTALIWALAVAVRLLNVAAMPLTPEVLLADDAAGYWARAGVLLETGEFAHRAQQGVVPETGRVPLYIAFVAGLRWLFGPSLGAVLALQSLIDATSCVLIALLWSRLSARAGTAAGLLAAIWPNLVIHSGSILTESLFLLPLTSLLWAAVRFLGTGSWRRAAAMGALLGVATMVRPIGQFLGLPFAVLAVAIPAWRGLGIRQTVLAGSVFAVAALIPVSPILYRNATTFDRLGLTTHGGEHLLWHVVPQVETVASGAPRSRTVRQLETAYAERLREAGLRPEELRPFQESRLMTSLALESLARMPVAALAMAWAQGAAINLAAPAILIDPRVHNLLPHPSFVETPGRSLPARGWRYFAESPWPYQMVLLIGGVGSIAAALLQLHGFALLWRRQRALACLAAGFILWVLLINGPIASPKYRIPFEPILIGLTALSVIELSKRWRPVPLPVGSA